MRGSKSLDYDLRVKKEGREMLSPATTLRCRRNRKIARSTCLQAETLAFPIQHPAQRKGKKAGNHRGPLKGSKGIITGRYVHSSTETRRKNRTRIGISMAYPTQATEHKHKHPHNHNHTNTHTHTHKKTQKKTQTRMLTKKTHAQAQTNRMCRHANSNLLTQPTIS